MTCSREYQPNYLILKLFKSRIEYNDIISIAQIIESLLSVDNIKFINKSQQPLNQLMINIALSAAVFFML